MVQKALTYKATMHRLKLIFLSNALLSINVVLMSYFSDICLETWFSWFRGGVCKTMKKKRKLTEKKALKNEETEEGTMQGKSNNANKHLL